MIEMPSILKIDMLTIVFKNHLKCIQEFFKLVYLFICFFPYVCMNEYLSVCLSVCHSLSLSLCLSLAFIVTSKTNNKILRTTEKNTSHYTAHYTAFDMSLKYFPPFREILWRRADEPSNRRAWGRIGKSHSNYKEIGNSKSPLRVPPPPSPRCSKADYAPCTPP